MLLPVNCVTCWATTNGEYLRITLQFTPPPHPNDFSNRPGFVSRHCHCSMTDGVCFITYRVNGWVATDATTERRNGAY